MLAWLSALRQKIRARAEAARSAVTAEADRLVNETGSDHLAYRAAREMVRALESDRKNQRRFHFYLAVRDELRMRWCGYLGRADTATRMLYRDELT